MASLLDPFMVDDSLSHLSLKKKQVSFVHIYFIVNFLLKLYLLTTVLSLIRYSAQFEVSFF